MKSSKDSKDSNMRSFDSYRERPLESSRKHPLTLKIIIFLQQQLSRAVSLTRTSSYDGYCRAYSSNIILRVFEVQSQRSILIESHEEFHPRAIVLHQTIRLIDCEDSQLEVVA